MLACAHFFDADRFDLNESAGVSRLESTELVHRRFVLIIQALGALSAFDDNIALVELQPDEAIDGPLAGRDAAGDELPFWGEEMSVIKDSAEFDGDELISQSSDIPVQGKTLKVDVGSTQDGSAGRLVASAGLDTNETVLDDIDPSNTVFPAKCVQGKEDLYSVGVGFILLWHVDLDGYAGFELDGNAFGLGGCIFGSSGQLPHIWGRCCVGVFEDTGFVGDVEEILISRPGLGGGLCNRDGLLFGIS